MTCPDLERRIDESDLSSRTRLVLHAYTRHVNPPTAKRPAPDHLIVWPSMEELMDVTAYSLDTIRYAKRELLDKRILEPVPGEGPWRRHTPRYRINPEKIQRNEAAIERRIARRQRRRSPPRPTTPPGEQGRETPHPFSEQGRETPHPLSEKGYGNSRPEVSSRQEREPEQTNFLGADPAPPPTTAEKKVRSGSRSQATAKTKTPAPDDDLPLTAEDHAWIDAKLPEFTAIVGVTPEQASQEWLDECRAQGYEWPDWPLMRRSRLRKRYHQALNHGRSPGRRPRDPIAARVRARRLAVAAEAPPQPVTCSWRGCDQPPCGHGPQTCRRHGTNCQGCTDERVAEAPPEPDMAEMPSDEQPGLVTTVEPPPHSAEVSPVTGDVTPVTPEPEAITATAAELLADVWAGSRTMPATSPPWRPLGSAPPRRAPWREPDQPTYHAQLTKRQARQAQATLAAD